MCYTRRDDQKFQEQARRIRAEQEESRKKQEKPLTEKAREMVGTR